MNKKISLMFCLFLFTVIYFLQDPLYQILINKDNNLETKQIHFEEDYQNLKKEYDLLLDYETPMDNAIISKVIIRNPLEFFSQVTILKGKNNGIDLGSAVFNENGLIGVVTKVYDNYSVVQLLPNKDTKIAVKIGNIYGVLESADGLLIVKNITDNEVITEQEAVVTSDLSNIAPNINVGTVKEVKATNQNLSYDIVIEPAVNFQELHYLWIKSTYNNAQEKG